MTDSISNQSSQDDLDLARYSRQILYKHIGETGQQMLGAARVTLIGCGALGTVLANTLVRAGVGFLRIVDRDFVELNNLQRQVLFDEQDVTDGTPKAVAAARQLARINSGMTVEPVVADVHSGNIESFLDSAQLILDGTDNFETRYLINDAAVKHGLPWIYGACVGDEGMVMPILPGRTPCLRCVFSEPPPPGTGQTCDTAGVLGPIVQIVASLQIVEAFKILTGQVDALNRNLVQISVWTGQYHSFEMQRAFDQGNCPCCKGGVYDYLSGEQAGHAVSLCGRDAVQVRPASDSKIDLNAIAAKVRLVAKAPPTLNRYLLRFEVDNYEFTLFEDGRAIIKGTAEPEEGRSVYAKYVGA
ncbi:MAG: ThiF family adenylyltransferase [Phycisphaerales bacterium]|nr:ThiF family adenylyltransferase [Phycisphaerales bacterium]